MSGQTFAWVIFLVSLLGVRVGAQGDGAIRAKTVAHADGSYTEIVTNENEMVSRVTNYDAAGKVRGKILNRLGSNLEPLKSYIYDSKGSPLYWCELKRDSNGRVSESIEYTPQNKLIRRVVYSYNSFGKLVGVKTFDSKGREIVAPQKS